MPNGQTHASPRLRTAALAAAAVALSALPAAAQRLEPAEHYATLERARGALAAERYAAAADLLAALTASNPADGRLWLEYGRASIAAGQQEQGLAALEKAFEIGVGFTRPYLALEIAAGHLRQGHREAALDWLERALEARWRDRSQLLRDTAFAALRDDPRFRRLAGALPDRALTRDEGWRHDLAYLVAEARRLHKDVERPAFSEAFEASARRLHERIPSLTDAEIVIEMRRLLTHLNDGHSGIQRGDGAARLPLDFYRFSDGLFVVRAEPVHEDLLGARVLAFGPVPTGAVFDSLASLVPRDNPMGIPWVGPRVLTDPALLKVIGATSDTTTVTLRVRDRNGAERDATVPASSIEEAPDFSSMGWDEIGRILARRKLPPPFSSPDTTALFLQRVPTSFWFTALPDADAVYFQYNQVRPEHGGESVAEFAARLRTELRDGGARNLIVDVRHNNGGNSYTFAPLLRVLAWFAESAPDHRIYMLIGRNTFSAAQNFTNVVSTLVDPVFVGEPTGSRPNFTGESGGFRLPYSGVEANVSFRTHQGTIWDEDGLWIWPDVPAELSSADYFADRDPGLDAVRALIRAGRRTT